MARPIKDTPVLKGKDIINFLKNMEKNNNNRNNYETNLIIKTNFNKLNSIATFHKSQP